MSETAVHVASGKVREIYELDPDRLLLATCTAVSDMNPLSFGNECV